MGTCASTFPQVGEFQALRERGYRGSLWVFNGAYEWVKIADFERYGDAECAARLFEKHVNG